MGTTAFPEITALSRHLDGCDPADRDEQSYNLDRLRELCGYVRRRNGPELAACLDATAQLIEALAAPGEHIERKNVHGIACRLLATVEQAITSFSGKGSAPAQSAAAPGEDWPDIGSAREPAPPAAQPEAAPAEAGTAAASPGVDPQTPSYAPKGNPELPLITNMVFGRLIVELGYATRAQVAKALKMHRQMGLPVGECLLLSGSTSPEQLLETLKLQEQMRAMAEPAEPAQPAAPLPANSPPAAQAQGLEPGDASIRVTKQIFLGEVLLGMSMITKQQLEKAMHIHHFEGLRIGQALVSMGALTMSDVQRGLDIQRSLLFAAGISTK